MSKKLQGFYISQTKLAIMSVTTGGLYQLYWFYRNWQSNQEKKSNFGAAVLAIFSGFTSYILFRKHVSRSQALCLAASYFILTPLWRLPGGWSLLGLANFIPLAIYQQWTLLGTRNQAIRKFSKKEIVFAIIGSCVLLLVILGTILPE